MTGRAVQPGGRQTMSWSDTAEPLTMVVVCNRERHRIRWRAGRVETLDHPDLDAELALIALGGEEPACVALHRLWSDAVDDGGFLSEWVEPGRLNPTWLSWLAMALERMRAEGFHEFLRDLPTARAQRMGQFLHRFPQAWIDRAAAEVNERVADAAAPTAAAPGDAGDPAESAGAVDRRAPLLAQAAANRLRRSFVDAVGGRQLAVGAAALVPLRPMVDPRSGVEPAIVGRLTGPDRGVSIVVDGRWLHDVWAAGAAVVDGRLVLAIDGDPTGPSGASARVATWAGPGPLEPTVVGCTIHHDGERWRLSDSTAGLGSGPGPA
ncbi:MAG: hypothetical protein AAGA93_11165 [Actinomycetota bacterium]